MYKGLSGGEREADREESSETERGEVGENFISVHMCEAGVLCGRSWKKDWEAKRK